MTAGQGDGGSAGQRDSRSRLGATDTVARPAVPRSRGPAVLVIQTAFLGDVVLTTPLLSALAERYGPVDVVTTPAAAPLLEGHPAVRDVIRYDKTGRDAGLGGLRRLGATLRVRGYARAYLPHRSWRSATLALLARVPQRTGFADSAAAITYTTRVARARAGHEVERLLALAGRGRGATPPGPAPRRRPQHVATPTFAAAMPSIALRCLMPAIALLFSPLAYCTEANVLQCLFLT